MLRIEGQRLLIKTSTLEASFERGALLSLRARKTGREFLEPAFVDGALELTFASGRAAGFTGDLPVTITLHHISDHCAEFRFHGWEADGIVTVSEDTETGAIRVEPSAYSSRPGVRACRWNLRGIPQGLRLVAPFFQGIDLPLSDALIRDSRWEWPHRWEAGFAILQGKGEGFWVHAKDSRYQHKNLKVGTQADAQTLGFETEAYGPLDANLSAGGLTWEINVYKGGWKVPAKQYRDWLYRAFKLAPREASRANWLNQIRLAVSWCNGDPALLEALAKQIDPRKVLIHFSQWRTDGYDENYPEFTPSPKARAFIAKGRKMGFHILPHANSVDMDPSHPVYAYLRDFAYREVTQKGLLGWGWENGKVLGVPNSNAALNENRRRKVMVKIHPGLSMWRSILTEQVQKGLIGLGVNGVFLDVTLCTWNLHQSLVENMTSTEGMLRLIDHVGVLNGGLAIGGEGRNEITAQGLSCAQAHLFNSHQRSCEGLERAGGCPVNEFLFGKLCRTFGYSGLSGKSETEWIRHRVHVSLGAIPTFAGLSPQEVAQSTPFMKELLKLAKA
jgi:hypothetical protein